MFLFILLLEGWSARALGILLNIMVVPSLDSKSLLSAEALDPGRRSGKHTYMGLAKTESVIAAADGHTALESRSLFEACHR